MNMSSSTSLSFIYSNARDQNIVSTSDATLYIIFIQRLYVLFLYIIDMSFLDYKHFFTTEPFFSFYTHATFAQYYSLFFLSHTGLGYMSLFRACTRSSFMYRSGFIRYTDYAATCKDASYVLYLELLIFAVYDYIISNEII